MTIAHTTRMKKGCTRMHYAYLRVSTDKQTTEQQRFEILKYADAQKLTINHWIEETVSGTTTVGERKLGHLLATMQPHDVLLVTELSRLGRSLMEVMSILHGLKCRTPRIVVANICASLFWRW